MASGMRCFTPREGKVALANTHYFRLGIQPRALAEVSTPTELALALYHKCTYALM